MESRPVSPPPRVASSRVGWREVIGLGLGHAAQQATHNTLHVIANSVFNMTLGMNPALLSTIMLIQRLWDAVIDPFIGHYSDNLRTPYGRRRPLMALAALPMIGSFLVIWFFPEGSNENELFWHLLGWSLLFYAAQSFFQVPHRSLVIEATDDYHERTRLVGVLQIFGLAVTISSQWLFPIAQSDWFRDPIEGVRWTVGVSALVFLAMAIAGVALTREHARGGASERSTQPKMRLTDGFKLLGRSRPFMQLALARLVFAFTYGAVTVLGAYMNFYLVFGGDLKAGAVTWGMISTVFFVCAIPSVFFFKWFARRHGKLATLRIAFAVLIISGVLKMLVYHPGQPWLQAIVLACNGVALTGLGLMFDAMLPDVVDHDELTSRERREGLYGATFGWFDKMGGSLGGFASGFILVWIGFDAKAGGAQASGVLAAMQVVYAAVPVIGALVALGLVRGYALDEASAARTRLELAGRRELNAV